MQYEQKKIARRIKQEREALGWTKGELASELSVNRNTITTWERLDEDGRIPPLDDMLNMCKLFDCEIGYLLCEEGYEVGIKTRKQADIQSKTGLSPKAVEMLMYWQESADNMSNKDLVDARIRVLSFLIENEEMPHGDSVLGFLGIVYFRLFGQYVIPLYRSTFEQEQKLDRQIEGFKSDLEAKTIDDEEYARQVVAAMEKVFQHGLTGKISAIDVIPFDLLSVDNTRTLTHYGGISSKQLRKLHDSDIIALIDKLEEIAEQEVRKWQM